MFSDVNLGTTFFEFLFYIIMSPYFIIAKFCQKAENLFYKILTVNKVFHSSEEPKITDFRRFLLKTPMHEYVKLMGRIGDHDRHFEYTFVSAKMCSL